MKFSFQSIYIALHVACQWKSASAFAPVAFVAPSSNLQAKSCNAAHLQYGRQSFLQMAKAEDDYVKADDWEALQALFASHCDKDGLMTKSTLEKDISAIQGLLDIGDLLQEELDDIWNAAPKFPELEGSAQASQQRIDVDSFIQIYRDIDDIFEDQEEEDLDTDVSASASAPSKVAGQESSESDASSADADEEEEGDEKELEITFSNICDDAGFVSKASLQNWEEVKELLDDGELSLEEFNEMWERTAKSPGSMEMIDVDGFLSFNVALDDLFEVVDEGSDNANLSEKDNGDSGNTGSAPAQIAMFYGDDLPPGVIFAEIADDNYMVGMDELRKWGDLQDMLKDGDLLPLELQNMFEAIPKASGTSDKLNEEGFESLFDAIEALFEDDENEVAAPQAFSSKNELLSLISELARDEDRLPCGLEGTDTEVELILETVSKLDAESTNLIGSDSEVDASDIAGDWELIYTTSAAMKFHKSLSGLVPPNGKFGGLVQKLKASKYLADLEYVEQINAGPASFEVKVTGDWELRSTVSLFTGLKSFCLDVVCDRVNYGLNSQKADHWKSLGALNLLDISYLDDNLRIMRGTTSTDSIFIFKKLG